MDWIRTLISRCAALFGRRRLDADLDDEVRAHIDLAVEESVRHGASAGEAHSAALRNFGGVTQIKEEYRMQRGAPFFQHLGRDLRFGVRQLAKNPSFTLTAVLTLALGIGANTAVFSVLDSVLLRPLPFANSARLARIYSVAKGVSIGPSPLDARDFARQNHTFEKIAVFDQWRKNVITSKAGDNAENVNVGLGNLDLFETLGIRPMVGRLFTEDEGQAGRNHVALISDQFWQSHYGRDPAILGRKITINGAPYTIIGVLPHGLPGWLRGVSASLEVWEPFLPTPDIWDEPQRGGRNFTAVGLLKPGVTMARAEADLKTIAANLASAYPIDRGFDVKLEPLVVSRGGDLRPQLYLLMGAVALILLIACSNLAALLLARNTARQREFAMRGVLGAARVVLVRQILAETLLVSLLGGAMGVALAVSIDALIRQKHPAAIPQLGEVALDWRVLVFTFAVAVGTSLIFGLAPAVMNTRINYAEALREGARGSSAPARHVFRKALVIAQIALSLVLTVSAALLLQTILRLVDQEMGFRADHLLKAHFFLPGGQYPAPDAITRFCDEFGDRVRAMPGVTQASITTIYPPYERWNMMFSIAGHPVSRIEDVPTAFFGVTDAYYLRTAGIALIEGRDFAAADGETTPAVAIVNQTFVRRFFGNEDPLGRRIDLGSPPNVGIRDNWLRQDVPVTVIGVMADAKDNGLAQAVEPQLITLFRQMPQVNFGFKDVIVRYETAPDAMERAVTSELHAMDSRLVLSEMASMDEYIERLTTDRRFTATILSGFAALGLLLAVVGIYGVISYLVAQRRQELGIRMALGADRGSVLRLILRQGIVLAASGVCVGLAATALAGRALSSLLYRTSASDALTLVAASAFLLLVTLAASIVPAWRATKVNPVEALRAQ
ncbi:MAG TPA: ABC transporter permease [Terracidiphilus sp.]|nr:ABC transporter permease [Terracidiphilus sp.]